MTQLSPTAQQLYEQKLRQVSSEGFRLGYEEGRREALEELTESNVVQALVHALDGKKGSRTYMYLSQEDLARIRLEAVRRSLGYEEIKSGKRQAQKRQKRSNTR
jgi:hypothetical protein